MNQSAPIKQTGGQYNAESFKKESKVPGDTVFSGHEVTVP